MRISDWSSDVCSSDLLAGLPPLSGFIAKFAIIDALLRTGAVGPMNWSLPGLIIVSGLATIIVMTPPGIDLLLTPAAHAPPHLSLVEDAAAALPRAVCPTLKRLAGPVLPHLEAGPRGEHHTRAPP